ncbi:MAG: transporter substrate-binding domain-containing protein [Clostridia bacterium]|nr:transporter substrate-binding domain-containing protein [Clostridia bacterium]
MKFTKILSLVMVALLAVMCFAACTVENPADENASGANLDENKDVVENKDAAENNEAEVPEAKVLKMATNAYFKPYEYYEGDKIVGIDAEIAAAIAEKLGYELVIEDMQFDSILTAVQTGSVDFGMAGMTVTEERLESVNFTSSYATGVQSVIVKEGSSITTVDDLFADGATYKAGVQLGTTGDIYASGDLGEDRVSQFANGNEAVMALNGGAVDCVIIDNQPAKALVEANEGLVILETSYADEEYAICVAKENEELLASLNAAIEELIADGTVDTIIAKYIK